MYGLLNASDEARHSAAHVVAMAVLKKFPKAKIGIGPVTREGFYYEFDLNRKIKLKDLEEIEKDMDRDYFMTSQEALEYGLIDKIIKKEI